MWVIGVGLCGRMVALALYVDQRFACRCNSICGWLQVDAKSCLQFIRGAPRQMQQVGPSLLAAASEPLTFRPQLMYTLFTGVGAVNAEPRRGRSPVSVVAVR
ncbi:uncharacterized protein CC84DRAFT_981519 [Paraphaeosphaeria sporulosa]|uniref:Secreted protein n=1 Tax=Paraphaeosphaeria sporulosa TaxID=1460663 RepID=A0A177C3I4_9PLEO|nr:uncharacterized protein CC84DRAFT_981519 [Paraphaeosphaeria sporulosa]OAG02035.1 hypothetical protein CC84DRAFT_981519 [Paraphaeosphaeria sporulosa]